MKRRENSDAKHSSEIASIESPDDEAFRASVLANRPVVLRNVFSEWPAVRLWNDAYLREKVGEQSIRVRVCNKADIASIVLDDESIYKQVRIAHLLDELAREPADATSTLYGNDNLGNIPALGEDIVPHSEVTDPNSALYIGRSSFTRTHYHPHCVAMLCQIVGHKRVVFYAPDEFENLYAYPWYKSDFFNTAVGDPELADRSKFPALRSLRPLECVLGPGDAVIIPLFWWHTVYGSDFSISVTQFWSSKKWSEGLWDPHRPLRHLATLALHRRRVVFDLTMRRLRRLFRR